MGRITACTFIYGKSVKGPLSGSAICNRPPASGFFAKGPLWKRFCKRPPAVPVHYAVHVLDKTVQLYETATGLSSTLPGHYRRTVEYRYCLLHVAWYCAALYCPCQYCAILFVRSYCSRTYYRSSRGATTLQLYRYRYFLPLLPALHVEVQRRCSTATSALRRQRLPSTPPPFSFPPSPRPRPAHAHHFTTMD